MSNCKKYKKTKSPKCKDQKDCDWVVGKGCLDKKTKAKKSSVKKTKAVVHHLTEEEEAIIAMEEMRKDELIEKWGSLEAAEDAYNSHESNQIDSQYYTYTTPDMPLETTTHESDIQEKARIFLVNMGDLEDVDYPDFPDNIVYVDDNEGSSQECYHPEWIYDKGTRKNHIKCKSTKEYNKLKEEYYSAHDEAEDKNFESVTLKLLALILQNGGVRGDLVENINESGYRSEGLYILDNDVENNLKICKLGTENDDYGNVPSTLSLSRHFNPGYWTSALGAFEKRLVINLTSYPNETSKAYWHRSEEHEEPLHLSNFNGLDKSHFFVVGEEEVDGEVEYTIKIYLSFMILIYTGGMTVDELLNEIKAKNHNLFNIKGDTIYVPPISANESELIVYN